MDQLNILSQSTTLALIIIICLCFVIFGVSYSKKYQGLENYLVANRSIGVFSLTTSLVASALGAWILFGPASAATWGGIGAVIGYALGTAFPLFILVFSMSSIFPLAHSVLSRKFPVKVPSRRLLPNLPLKEKFMFI
mgnify:CR=1 FL=1